MKRTVAVSTRGTRLSLEQARCVVRQENDVVARIPVEDIGMLVLESSGIGVSSGLMVSLSANGAAVLCADQAHLPVGLMLPIAANSLHAERVLNQARVSEPTRKNLWSRIVRAKIENQSACVGELPAAEGLAAMARTVRSGDPSNVEAQAAKAYWKALFLNRLPDDLRPFRRRRAGAAPNALLNYGYAVLRAATARALCGAGLHPGLGIHHHNRYSAFPLADDLMEPFRPWVDATVSRLVARAVYGVCDEARAALLAVLQDRVVMTTGSGPLMSGLERSAATLAQALDDARRGAGAVEAAAVLDLPCWPSGDAGVPT